MIESRLLVAKPFAFLLNQSRSRLLYFSRSGGLLRFLVLLLAKLLLCLLLSRLLAQRLKVLSLAPKASVKAKDLIQQKSRMLSAADMRLQLGDHIMP